jgi:MFS family permease
MAQAASPSSLDTLPAATPRLRRAQRASLAMLVAAGAVNYIDRATLAIGNPLIRHDLDLSVADMGWLLSAFLWAYAFSQLPAGGLIDRLGPRRLLGAGMAVWSVAQVFGGLSQSFGQFVAARVALGIGEAPMYPACGRVVRDWFAVRHRGAATGIFNCSSTLGTAISAPLCTVLMLQFGWRWMFAIMGIAGLIVAAVWFAMYRDVGDAGLTREEEAYRRSDDAAGDIGGTVGLAAWGRLFGCRTTWGMVLGFFGTIYLTWIYTAWLPGYLEMQRHMSIKASGWASAIPYVAGVVGSVWGGWLVDWLMRRGLSPINSRKYPMSASLLGMAACTVVAAEIPSNVGAIAAISAAMFLGYVSSTTAWAMASVAAPASYTGSLGAMQNFGGYLGGALAPAVTGLIVQATGSFVPALLVGAVIGVVSAVGYFTVIQRPIVAEDLGEAAALGIRRV